VNWSRPRTKGSLLKKRRANSWSHFDEKKAYTDIPLRYVAWYQKKKVLDHEMNVRASPAVPNITDLPIR
jgi:hypothetical protein